MPLWEWHLAFSIRHSARLLFGLEVDCIVGMVSGQNLFSRECTRINTNQKRVESMIRAYGFSRLILGSKWPRIMDEAHSFARSAMKKVLFVVTLLIATAALAQAPKQQIKGEYLETRSADVYTGQCFANGEMNTAGDQAIVAWHIQDGSWDGVSLAGLSVV